MLTKLALSFVLIFAEANAALLKGEIKLFSGQKVETGKPYSYVAFQTKGGQRILLPDWFKGDEFLKSGGNHNVTVVGDVSVVYCTDMSAACPTGKLKNVKSLKVIFNEVNQTGHGTFSGRVERFTGRGVTTPKLYDYLAVEDKQKVAVPTFLDAQALFEDQADLVLVGKPNPRICVDMSAACGPSPLAPLKSVQINF